MIALFAREVADLERFFNDCDGEIRRDVRSLQSGFELEMEARSRRARHRPRVISSGGHIVCVDNGLRCGPIYVGQGDDGHAIEARGPDPHALAAVRFESRVRAALRNAGEEIATILRLRFREVLPPSRIQFGLYGASAPRGRPIAGAIGVRLHPVRGPGNLAHLTDAARAAYGATRTRRDLPAWVDALGRKLAQPHVTQQERALGKAIAQQCELLELAALAAYKKAQVRVPPRVVRAALARAV